MISDNATWMWSLWMAKIAEGGRFAPRGSMLCTNMGKTPFFVQVMKSFYFFLFNVHLVIIQFQWVSYIVYWVPLDCWDEQLPHAILLAIEINLVLLISPWRPFYKYGLTLSTCWISNYIHYKAWDETYFGVTVEVWEYINSYPYWDYSDDSHISRKVVWFQS